MHGEGAGPCSGGGVRRGGVLMGGGGDWLIDCRGWSCGRADGREGGWAWKGCGRARDRWGVGR